MINLFFQAQSAGRFRAVLPMGRVGIFRPLRSLQLGKLVYPSLLFSFPSFRPFSPFFLCLVGDISSGGGGT